MVLVQGVGWDSNSLRAGRPGGSNPGGGRDFSALVQTGPGAHPASYTMGTVSFPGGGGIMARAWRRPPTPI